MRGIPSVRGLVSGPQIFPSPKGFSVYASIDPYYYPDYWTNGFAGFRITGISSKIQIRFDLTVPFSNNKTAGWFASRNYIEEWSLSTEPVSQGLDQIANGSIFTVNNGDYLTFSLDSQLIGQDADYGVIAVRNYTALQYSNIGTQAATIATVTLELMPP
jgi:hypothetical protein